jgi:transcriptional regulator with XRE-family HTH domain
VKSILGSRTLAARNRQKKVSNVVGGNITKFRQQHGWTRGALAAKLQLLGFNITYQILANIETGRCAVTDAQIVFLSEVFRIPAGDLFPLKSKSRNGQRKSYFDKELEP